jgi:hypothetical protein
MCSSNMLLCELLLAAVVAVKQLMAAIAVLPSTSTDKRVHEQNVQQ